jgi:hypothetical protein
MKQDMSAEALREWLDVTEPRCARVVARRVKDEFPDATPKELHGSVYARLRMLDYAPRLARLVADEISGWTR